MGQTAMLVPLGTNSERACPTGSAAKATTTKLIRLPASDRACYGRPVISIFLLFYFPRLISAVADWMSAILPHVVWP